MVSRFRIQAPKKQEVPHLRFVESVRVHGSSSSVRIRWKHLLLGGFWFLIIVKCLLAHWAIQYWEMPVASVYVWGPTIFAAVICTVAFLAGGKQQETG